MYSMALSCPVLLVRKVLALRPSCPLTATLQPSSFSQKLLDDATSMADVREAEMGERAKLEKSMSQLPQKLTDITTESFADMCLWLHDGP